jgi:feruloyl esterase
MDSAGNKLFPSGYALGSETDEWKGWVNNRTLGPSGPTLKSRNYQVSEQFLRYLTFEKSPGELDYDPLKFNFDRDPAKLARARSIYDATSVDLGAFRAHGGKVLIWHGWADGGIPAPASIDYYLRVLKLVGSRKETESFIRLFLLPGVHHCAGGDGADQLDALAILDEWVEHGKAPEMILTTKTVDGKVTRARPVYPYPKVAIYGGSGDVNDPKNWKVVDSWPAATDIPEPSGIYR